ncbi:hypothetical protein [Actinomadura macrotermitis]|uniref:hypothetical protein n=1 Tax=Actinomadura macrotermitis TaxID=2585200 RepID=UPI0012982021|nr:hypothetical protein [Actinomadura macrotermitis]
MAGLSRLNDNSFLIHLRTGHWILDHGIPHHDIYSFTFPGISWVAQSWLAEVLYALLDRSAGPVAIRLVNGLTGAVIAVLAARLATRARGGGRTGPLVLPAVAVSAMLWAERPLLFGVAAMLALVWIVELPDSFAGRHARVAVPLLMWFWVNTHGTFMLGFGYLALHLAGRWWDGAPPWRARELSLLQGTLLAFGAAVVNPYGVRLLLFPLELMGRGEALDYVQEWKSPDFRAPMGIAFALFVLIFFVVLARAEPRPDRRDLVVAIPFLFLGFWALRNLAVTPLVCLPIAARLLGERPSAAPSRRRLAWTWLALVPSLLVFAAVIGQRAASEPGLALGKYPVQGMRAVEQRGLLGHRLLTTDEWGAYVIHAYWPRQRVFMDDRFDMYPVPFTVDYMKAVQGRAQWRGLLDRNRIDVVVWPVRTPLGEILGEADGWTRVHQDATASVFVRR